MRRVKVSTLGKPNLRIGGAWGRGALRETLAALARRAVSLDGRWEELVPIKGGQVGMSLTYLKFHQPIAQPDVIQSETLPKIQSSWAMAVKQVLQNARDHKRAIPLRPFHFHINGTFPSDCFAFASLYLIRGRIEGGSHNLSRPVNPHSVCVGREVLRLRIQLVRCAQKVYAIDGEAHAVITDHSKVWFPICDDWIPVTAAHPRSGYNFPTAVHPRSGYNFPTTSTCAVEWRRL